jgi:hypothetical protein
MVKASRKSRKPRRRTRQRDPLANIPNKASIIATDTLVMPDGSRYAILKTDQTDPYDLPPKQRRRKR